MRALFAVALSLALALAPVAGFAHHGKPLPLPSKHSVIAQNAQNLNGQIVDACGKGEVLVASFDEAGYHWLYIYAVESQVGIFVQYEQGVSEPIRAWFFHGAEDDVVITVDVENPVNAFANICVALYPKEA